MFSRALSLTGALDSDCGWLLNINAGHEPVELLPGQIPCLALVPRPAVSPVLHIQALVQENVSVTFPDLSLDAVTAPPAKQEKGVIL